MSLNTFCTWPPRTMRMAMTTMAIRDQDQCIFDHSLSVFAVVVEEATEPLLDSSQ